MSKQATQSCRIRLYTGGPGALVTNADINGMSYNWFRSSKRFHIGSIMSQTTCNSTINSQLFSLIQKKTKTPALAFVAGILRWPMDSPHKGPLTRKVFLCDNVIM